tara:strand:+ start:3848 stop:4762 length:915 start_codon:yes stop_codon:yes gene_type:complete
MSDWEVVGGEEQHANTPMQSEWGTVPYESQEESFLHKLPRNILIGLTHAGRGLHNLPHDIASGVDYVGSGIGRAFGAKEFQNGQSSHLADYLPYDEQSYADVFGQKGQGTQADKFIQKGIEFAPDIIGGVNALRGLKLLPHLTRRGASKSLVKAKDLAKGRNIGTLNVNPELVEDAAQFLPKTSAYKNMLEGAGYGDYNELFKLQSDLGKHSSDYARSLFSAAERSHGRAGMATRNKLLSDMHQGLKDLGHEDISALLKKGQDEYRRYAKFKPYRNALGVAAGAYMMPKNALIDLVKKLVTAKD